MVFGTEPGEPDYSPLWNETTVRWKPGVKPILLFKDDQVKRLLATAGFSSPRINALPPDPDARGPALFVASATRA